MPGYEVDRFVGYPENEATCQLLKDLSCSICLEVLCRPVLTGGCCYEAYCESCLKVWLEANHTCPSDNKLLKEEALAPPPTLLVKQIGKLKLKCVFEERGCKVVTTVAKIEAHEKSCLLNGEPCGTCGLYPGANGNGNGSSSHSCLKALLEHRKTVSAAMDRLCLEMDEAELEHRNVRSQIDNCKKILKALTVERVSQSHSRPSSSSSSSSSSSGRIRDQRDLLTEARRYISSPIVEARQTRKELVERVLEVVKEAVTGGGQHFEEFKHAHGGRSHYRHNPVEFVVRYVKEALDGSCLGDWNAYARYNGLGAVCHHLLEDGYVEVKLGKVTITVFRTVESLSFSRLCSLIKAGAVHDFALTKPSAEESKSNRDVEKVALACLHSTASLSEFTEKVNLDLAAHMGGVWSCCVHQSGCGYLATRSSSSPKSNPDVCTYTLQAGDVKILLFHTKKVNE